MQYLEEGVLLSFEEYVDYEKTLKALAALRQATSFQNTQTSEVKA